jgi:hypothetical protein
LAILTAALLENWLVPALSSAEPEPNSEIWPIADFASVAAEGMLVTRKVVALSARSP